MTVLNLPHGTHRLKFFVDGVWKCSPDLDTALDGHGNLVNYVEVKDDEPGFWSNLDVTADGTLPSLFQMSINTCTCSRMLQTEFL
jgi:hypothetical protein